MVVRGLAFRKLLLRQHPIRFHETPLKVQNRRRLYILLIFLQRTRNCSLNLTSTNFGDLEQEGIDYAVLPVEHM